MKNTGVKNFKFKHFLNENLPLITLKPRNFKFGQADISGKCPKFLIPFISCMPRVDRHFSDQTQLFTDFKISPVTMSMHQNEGFGVKKLMQHFTMVEENFQFKSTKSHQNEGFLIKSTSILRHG